MRTRRHSFTGADDECVEGEPMIRLVEDASFIDGGMNKQHPLGLKQNNSLGYAPLSMLSNTRASTNYQSNMRPYLHTFVGSNNSQISN